MEEYKRRQFRDKALWKAFGEDFEGWTKQMFDKANKPCIRELRDLTRENGVFVRKEKLVSITNELVKVINEKEPHEWTTEQVKE